MGQIRISMDSTSGRIPHFDLNRFNFEIHGNSNLTQKSTVRVTEGQLARLATVAKERKEKVVNRPSLRINDPPPELTPKHFFPRGVLVS